MTNTNAIIRDGHYNEDDSNLTFVLSPEKEHPAGVSLVMDRSTNEYTLIWTDFVANDWTETYDSLSIALARLAVLTRCAERNWNVGFTRDETEFADYCDKFLSDEAQ